MTFENTQFQPKSSEEGSSEQDKNAILIFLQAQQKKLVTHQKLFFGVLAFVALLLITITMLSYKPTYVSKSILMIKDTALTAKYVTGDSYETTTSQSTSSVINTMGLLRADAFKHELYGYFQQNHPEELKAKKIDDYEDWDAFYGNGDKLFGYGNAPGTDLINLEFKWSHPRIAAEGLQVVIETFKELSLKLNQGEQRERSQYLTSQIAEIQTKLTTVRQRIGQLKENNEIIDLAEENANLARVRLNLKTDMKTARAEATGQMNQLSSYQQMLGMNPKQAVTASALGRNENLAKLHTELYSLRSERNSLLTRYTEESVKVQDIDSRIKQLEDNIDREMKRTVGGGKMSRYSMAVADNTRSEAVTQMISAKAHASELGSKSRVLQQYLGELDTRAKRLNKVSVLLADLKLEEASLDESLKILKEKEIDAQLKESQTLSNVFVAEPPQVPLKPSAPTRLHFLLADLILAFGCAYIAVVAVELLTNRYGIQVFPARSEAGSTGFAGRSNFFRNSSELSNKPVRNF